MHATTLNPKILKPWLAHELNCRFFRAPICLLVNKLQISERKHWGCLASIWGNELHAVIQRLRSSISEKVQSKRGRSRQDTSHSVSLHAASLLLEAIYLKAVSLQKLGRLTEAAQECKSVLDTIETVFPQGMPESLGNNKLQINLKRILSYDTI